MKTCSMCLKEIDKRAKKCPYCQHFQSIIRTLLHNPTFSLMACVIVLIMVFASTIWFLDSKHKGDAESRFTTNTNLEFDITESRIEFGKNSCGGQTVTVLGNITNKTDTSWISPQFELVFYDNKENVTDTEQIDKHSFNIPAQETLPFKLSMKKEFDDSKYIGHDVRIIYAQAKHNYY